MFSSTVWEKRSNHAVQDCRKRSDIRLYLTHSGTEWAVVLAVGGGGVGGDGAGAWLVENNLMT